jgi:Sec-independent protein secretion pathway component TatC
MNKSRWQRFKEWWTIDHVVDLCVDALLLIWEVVSSPILIVVRIIRHFIGDWFVGGIKSIIKIVVRWFARKREYRLEHGHGILRTYWWLILLSPIILFFLFIFLAMITGIAKDLPVMLELLIRGCESLQPGAEQYWCNIS